MVVYRLDSGQAEPTETDPRMQTPKEYKLDWVNIETSGSKTITQTQTFSLDLNYNYFVLFMITDGGYDPYFHTYETNKHNYTTNAYNIQGVSDTFSLGQAGMDSNGNVITDQTTKNTTAPLDLDCGIRNLAGCIAQIFYAIFGIAAFIGELAGKFLDFFVYYSTNSTSYTSGFVTKGWGAIRDVANIFFIIALLYIAIKTILNLNVSNNKKLISYIVIIALLINFSLFFTQVIIDGSNILAKVFYNSIESKDANGALVRGETGEKSISVGLISLFNPQKLVTQKVLDSDGGTALFIFITLLATALVLYAAWIFFTVAILFVSRVVMLWISMIFSPIAFASYTLPFDIPGLGHKEWWGELLKNAFLAPIFIFFLYIIVMFAGFLKDIVHFPDGADFMQKVMAVVIPFAILMVLLMKAKELAVKYSGEMGKAMSKAGAMVSGAVVGGAVGLGIGGAAALGQKTLGRASGAIGRNISANTAVGRFWKNRFNDASKSSFNVAAIPGAGKLLSKAGVKDVKPKYANYEERVKARDEKRKKRSREYEVQANEKEAIAVRKAKAHVEEVKTKQGNEKVAGYRATVIGTDSELKAALKELTDKLGALGEEIKPIQDMANILTKDADTLDKNADGLTKEADTLEKEGKGEAAEAKRKEADTMRKTAEAKRKEADTMLRPKAMEMKSVENELKTLALGDTFVSTKISDKDDVGKHQTMSELKAANDNIQGKIALKNQQVNEMNLALTNATTEAEKNDLREKIAMATNERKRYIEAIQSNTRGHDILHAPIHHAEVELTRAENTLAAENKKRIVPFAKNLENRIFNTFRVGGQAGAERIADEIRIKTASENVEKKVPTAPKSSH
jgi:hypothetical protein